MSPSFQFVSGCLTLDFVNTVGDGLHPTNRRDFFQSPDDVAAWLVAAGLERSVGPAGKPAPSDLRRIAAERDRLFRIFSAVAHGKTPRAADVAALGQSAATAYASRRLQRVDDGFAWEWTMRPAWERALARIAIEAAELLVSDDRARIRQCEDEVCGWLFIDRSRGVPRRWCSMADCGNRAKARRHYRRRRRAARV